MNTQAHDRIEAFLADITACDASYGHCRLLVVAIRSYDALNIVYASIIFSPFPGQDDREYDTGVVYCMSREITFDRAKQLLHNIAEGKFDVDGRQFVLRSNALVVPALRALYAIGAAAAKENGDAHFPRCTAQYGLRRHVIELVAQGRCPSLRWYW